MSLLALIADKFELEQPTTDSEHRVTSYTNRPVDETDNDVIKALLDNDHDTTTPNHSIEKRHMSISQDKDIFYDATNDTQSTTSDDDCSRINAQNSTSQQQEDTKLLITFLLMVIVGTANKIFQKLQAIPMYNYPNSLNLLQNFVYVSLCFAYILPVSRYNLFNNAIPAVMNKKPFIVMGFLDCVTCLLMTFAAVYLPGSLLILLPQAAIPISMILSKHIKGESYFKYQYLGAVVVVLGILVVLEPLVTQRHVADYTCLAYDEHEFCALCSEETTEEGCSSHGITSGGDGGGSFVIHEPWDEEKNVILRSLIVQNDTSTPDQLCHWVSTDDQAPSSSGSSTSTTLLWSVVTILACIPMTLSSIYKELALSGSQQNLDPIFLNGWVAFYQLLFSFPLSVPAGMTSSPPVPPHELPQNIWDGIKCYLGIATITTGCHPDDQCHLAPLYVNVFLVFNVCFNILIVYVLKYGSANVLFMASTVMVPIGNLAFALPFMPGSTPLKDSDIAGLLVILFGLVTYRFGNTFKCRVSRHWMTITSPFLWRRRAKQRSSMLNGDESFEWDAPLYDDDNVNGSGLLEEPLITPLR